MFLKHTSRKLCAINLIFLCVLGGGEKTEEKKVQIPQAAHTYINKDRVSEDWFELEDRFERTKIERSQEWTLNFLKSRGCENIFVAWLSLVGFTFTRGKGKCKIMQINGVKGGEIGASALVPRPPRVLSINCDSKEKYETVHVCQVNISSR